MQQDGDNRRTMAQLDDEQARRVLEEQIRMMSLNDNEQRRLRYEWRKMLENGYDEDILEHERRADVEKKEVLTGPTSLNVLGTYYQQ